MWASSRCAPSGPSGCRSTGITWANAGSSEERQARALDSVDIGGPRERIHKQAFPPSLPVPVDAGSRQHEQGVSAMDWRHRALCRDEDPELFFPIGNTGPALLQIEEARTVCRRCTVTEDGLS